MGVRVDGLPRIFEPPSIPKGVRIAVRPIVGYGRYPEVVSSVLESCTAVPHVRGKLFAK